MKLCPYCHFGTQEFAILVVDLIHDFKELGECSKMWHESKNNSNIMKTSISLQKLSSCVFTFICSIAPHWVLYLNIMPVWLWKVFAYKTILLQIKRVPSLHAIKSSILNQ